MYNELIGLTFEEVIKELDNHNIKYDFGETSYKEIIDFIHECELNPNELSFEETYIYIGGYWQDLHYDVHFNDNFKVDFINTFEGWD